MIRLTLLSFIMIIVNTAYTAAQFNCVNADLTPCSDYVGNTEDQCFWHPCFQANNPLQKCTFGEPIYDLIAKQDTWVAVPYEAGTKNWYGFESYTSQQLPCSERSLCKDCTYDLVDPRFGTCGTDWNYFDDDYYESVVNFVGSMCFP